MKTSELASADVPEVCFVSASGQNVFFAELSDALRNAMARCGVATSVAVDHFPLPRDGLGYVFVPHEYLPLTLPGAHPTDEEVRRTVVISTEQPGTTWFEETARIAFVAGATLDINPLGLAELRRRQVQARRLRLGYVPEWDRWGGDEATPRRTDVTFFGGYTPRRARALASCGRVLRKRRSALHLIESLRPHTSGAAQFLAGQRKWEHLSNTKILVNVHRAEHAYFEWQRVVEAIANGCVVVSEHSLGFAPLVPGEHFVSVSLESLPLALEELLEDEDRLRELRMRAYRFLRDELPLDAGGLIDSVREVAGAPVVEAPCAVSATPAPRALPVPRPEWARLSEQPNESDLMRISLKRLVLGQRRLERRLERLEVARDEPESETRAFGLERFDPPRVSVVVTLFNYESFIEEALSSVALSDYRDFELVVVDDASTDRSTEVAADTLGRFTWLPSRLVRVRRNAGLPAARNLGVKQASGEYIFMLDADNTVYPHALARLVKALDDNADAAFAYGMLEKFDAAGPYDLMSWLAWTPERFARGNYVDATALIRRSALERVGGYPTDDRLYGWEDFALWCSFADAGLWGILVPEIVARYRAGRISMINLTNIDVSDAWSALLERYVFLRELDPSGP
jgi:Glycosyl transferase family 2/Glycosyl transferases group 1